MKALIDGDVLDKIFLWHVPFRQCSECSEVKPLDGFILNKQCKYGYARRCSWCDRIYKRAYYERNILRKRELANKLNREKKDKAIAYMGGECHDCGGQFHRCCFDFHHVDGTKEGNPSKFLAGSWEKAEKELQKCVLLCANCHRLRHFKEDSKDESVD